MASSAATVSALINQTIVRKGDISAVQLNAILQMIVGLTTTGGDGPSVAAYLAAMENMQPGSAAAIRDALPPDPSNAINMLYEHVPFVTAGNPLEVFFGQITGLDMGTVRAAAAAITE